MRMTETGKIKRIEEPAAGEKFAEQFIRYAPRRVVLEPGQTQTVRLLVRKPGGLEAAEYRSHLLLRAIPKEAGLSIDQALSETQGVKVRLVPVYGLSIPVIVRHGRLSADVQLAALDFVDASRRGERPHVAMRIHRTGERSVYGDITVTFVPRGEPSEPIVVGRIAGLAVYTPNAIRKVMVPLHPPEGVTLERGRLEVMYRARASEGGAVLARAQVRVP